MHGMRCSLLVLQSLFVHDNAAYEEAELLLRRSVKAAMEAFTICKRFCIELKANSTDTF